MFDEAGSQGGRFVDKGPPSFVVVQYSTVCRWITRLVRLDNTPPKYQYVFRDVPTVESSPVQFSATNDKSIRAMHCRQNCYVAPLKTGAMQDVFVKPNKRHYWEGWESLGTQGTNPIAWAWRIGVHIPKSRGMSQISSSGGELVYCSKLDAFTDGSGKGGP